MILAFRDIIHLICEYHHEIATDNEKILGGESGDWALPIHNEKRTEISCFCFFKEEELCIVLQNAEVHEDPCFIHGNL